ncbi:hypothetical protein [Marivita cryptomonadis]|uniref:Uncharacterized protein n=1 Tax=Marivita cryptomonadis TaxID=505252 RepID=A0A9Q2P768_9RHOB|nr:hypothetical protein [Marivita cryptomonadis]MCR9169841.1 hypothetical protein [Paracoccaceae bacterium]MBM2333088.1 hypothetical protein [Marivita cryptomonadis]MBM2347336.1 hypothetical protein [Marivita cryptomonadis]MBM2352019.1 hypothetical protein [Marivita cryptomonadis]MBM2371193.1 hypothetical protein [Marivita cryptomonadis]
MTAKLTSIKDRPSVQGNARALGVLLQMAAGEDLDQVRATLGLALSVVLRPEAILQCNVGTVGDKAAIRSKLAGLRIATLLTLPASSGPFAPNLIGAIHAPVSR